MLSQIPKCRAPEKGSVKDLSSHYFNCELESPKEFAGQKKKQNTTNKKKNHKKREKKTTTQPAETKESKSEEMVDSRRGVMSN